MNRSDIDSRIARAVEIYRETPFHERLRALRVRRTISQTTLSDLSGLPQQTVSRMERGLSLTVSNVERYISGVGCVLVIGAIVKGQAHEELSRIDAEVGEFVNGCA